MNKFNAETLMQIMKDKEKMDFHQMFSKYMPLLSQSYNASTYMKIQDLESKMKEFEKGNSTVTNEELKSLFNKTLFRAMPMDCIEVFATTNPHKKDFKEFIDFYKELKKIQEANGDVEMFHDACDEVQSCIIDKGPAAFFQKYLNYASEEVQNEKFLELFEVHPDVVLDYYSFPGEIYRKNEKLVMDYVPIALQEKIELLDILGAKETLRRCSEHIFKKIPDEMKYDVIDEFTKAELEIIKNENVPWEEIEETLTGEELLEILNSGHFEQEEGQVFHLKFDSTQSDVGMLIELAKKYKISCDLTVESCADLPMKSIQILNAMGIDINSVRFKQEDLDFEQQQPYDIETYKKCLGVIDIMTRDIEEVASVKQNDSDRDKKVCGTVTRRLANLTRYNDDYYFRLKHKETTKEEDIVNGSLIGALLNGECVCAGYAEAERNLLACCGIESRYISADNKDPHEFGHAWNQAKLDGEWTNLDVTWDANRIVKGEAPKYCFKSDEEFGHDEYIPRVVPHKCKKTITNARDYMGYRRIEMNETFRRLLRRGVKNCEITFSEVGKYEEQRNRAAEKDEYGLQK